MTAESGQQSYRQTASSRAATTARVLLGCTIVLAPFRLGLDLLTRPSPPVYPGYTDFFLFASDAAMLATIAAWAVSLALSPRHITLGPRHVWIPLVCLSAAAWISTAVSYDAWLSVYQAVRLLVLIWFYLFIVNELTSPRWVVIPVVLQLAIQSIVALGQFALQHSLGLQALGELTLDPAASGTSVITAAGVRLLRAYGLTDHPNILGGCLAFGLVLVLLPAVKARSRTGLLAAFILATAALVTTFSRSAWVAFAAGATTIAAVEIFSRHGQAVRDLLRLGAASILIPVIIIAFYSPFFGVRLGAGRSFSTATAEQQSLGERLLLVRSTAPILLAHPLTGVGIGAAPVALEAYYPQFGLNYEPPHWTLFDAALETGLLGASPYLALLALPIVVYIRRRAVLRADAGATAAFALLIALTVVGLFDYYTWLFAPGRTWQWLAWGLWGAALERTA